ncbi:MAG: RNA polymerase sigma factor region1.1 domain-containing protein [Candidatus Saccharimonadales bacterium]
MARRKRTDDTATATKPAPSKNYDKEIAKLLERGRKEGKLDQHEIFELIPDTPANIDALEQLYAEM